jgi:hypothetical protein
MGDPNFLARGRIDPSTAQASNRSGDPVPLGAPTAELAATFGYDMGGHATRDRRSRRDSLAAQRERRTAGRQRDVA